MTYPDGSGVVVVDGVRLSVGCRRLDGSRHVYALSDWGRVSELVAAGVLAVDVWHGDGTCGHDNYRLLGDHCEPS